MPDAADYWESTASYWKIEVARLKLRVEELDATATRNIKHAKEGWDLAAKRQVRVKELQEELVTARRSISRLRDKLDCREI